MTASAESLERWRTAAGWNVRAAAVGGALANAVLLALLWRVRVPHLRRHALVLAINCAADMLWVISMIFVQTEVAVIDRRLYLFISGPLMDHPAPLGRYFPPFLCTLNIKIIRFIPPLVFVYRYCIVVKQSPMSNRAVLRLVGGIFAISITHSASFTAMLIDGEEESLRECAKLHEQRPLWWPRGVALSRCISLSQSTNWMRVSMSVTISLTLLSLAVMGCSAVGIWRYLRRNAAQMSQKTRRLHRQLNTVLAVQMLLPLLLYYLPIIILQLWVYCGSDDNNSLHEIGTTMALYWLPFVRPMSTLLIVGPYRQEAVDATQRFLFFQRRQASDNKIVPNNITCGQADTLFS